MNALSITSLTLTSGGGETLVLPWSSLATADVRAHARVESNAWIKRLRLVPYGDVPMRDRFTYRGDSLWWFTELYLHKMRQLETAVVAVFDVFHFEAGRGETLAGLLRGGGVS